MSDQKILPLLSKLIPSVLALKGISKINPKLGDFVTSAVSAGHGADSILDFLRDKMESQGTKSERQRLLQSESQGNLRPDEMQNLQNLKSSNSVLPASAIGAGAGISSLIGNEEENQTDQNKMQQTQQSPFDLISGYSPELTQFIKDKIQLEGLQPEQAAAIAYQNKKFIPFIKSIEKDSKENFVDMITRLFGRPKVQGQQKMSSQTNQNQSSPAMQRLSQVMEQGLQMLGR